MRPSAAAVSLCVSLVLVVSSVSDAVQRLNSIHDLKNIKFGQDVPVQSLLLLHWFANEVEIDNNNVIRLSFDPNQDYGSHHYGNYEDLLDPLPPGYRYYTVGNINQNTSDELTAYVTQTDDLRSNLVRIIFRVRQHNRGQIIDQVYITQHYGTAYAGTEYDPDRTYQVTTNLLRQIRRFSVEGNNRSLLAQLRNDFGSNADESQLRSLRNTWGNLACLGLLLFIVIEEKHSAKKQNKRRRDNGPQNNRLRDNGPGQNIARDFVIDVPESDDCAVEVVTGAGGKAGIRWSNVARHRLKEGAMVVLYKDGAGGDSIQIQTSEGRYNTSEPLNDGLQARLHIVRKRFCFFSTAGPEIYRGPEFRSPEPVDIRDSQARLQLFVKDGKASARLYVSKSFCGWKSQFKKSWVGFYTSPDKDSDEYQWWQWQWVTKFTPSSDHPSSTHEIYEYQSSMNIAPGVQARFILRDYDVKASTPGWI